MIRVLIVDDREENRQLLSTLLKSNGYEVESACHGAEALDKARQNPPQLIISDLLMPRMDGYTLLRQCKADDQLKQVPFVVFTATYTEPKDEQLALSLGADAFILKPAEPADFIARISQVIAAAASGKQTAIQTPASAVPARKPIVIPKEEEARNLRLYSEVLIHKLEDKMEDLDKANRELQRDIAEQKQMQKRLTESERKARAIFDRAFGFVGLLNPDGSLVEANRSALDFAGVQLSDVVGKPLWETPWWTHSTEGREQIRAAMRVAASGELVRFETTFLATDGVPHTFDFSLKPVKDESGRVVLLIPEGRDITDRKRAEDELHWKTALLEAQVDSALDGILVVDNQGKQILRNERLNKLWKIPPHLAEGKDDAAQVQFAASQAKNPREFAEKVAYLYSHPDEVSRDEIELIDGTILDRYSSPVRDKAGKYYGRIWTFRDITQHRTLEAQFRQVQKMEAVGQLAAGVAHDFNNILAVIQLQASFLKTERDLAPQQLESASEIENAAKRAANLTRQLLLFSRRQTMQPRDLDLNQSINDMTKMLRRTIGDDIQVQFKFAMEPLLIHADAGMLDQVLMNLAVNAHDAMPQGGQLVIETSAVEFDESVRAQSPLARPGSFVCLSVSDTGCGIPPENLPRIFEPFFTTTDISKGTGLGLATVFGIVEQHQGWVSVCSEVGRGTTFRIYLPRLAAQSGQESGQPELATVRGGKETILIVEDEGTLRSSMRKALSQLGYRVLESVSGVEAQKVWEQHRNKIVLLVTDLVMPGGMTGRDLAERFLKENSKLKVIYTSGYSVEVASKDFPLEEGVNFLAKPFGAHKLAQTVRDRLDRK